MSAIKPSARFDQLHCEVLVNVIACNDQTSLSTTIKLTIAHMLHQRISIRTVNTIGPRAALQRRRRKCVSLTVRVGYRFLCTTSATLWSLAKSLKSALVKQRVWHPAGTQALRSRDAYMCQ